MTRVLLIVAAAAVAIYAAAITAYLRAAYRHMERI